MTCGSENQWLGLSWCHGFVTERLSHGEGVPGASCPCTGAAAASSAISPLHPKGTLSLPHENSFPVVIFPVSIIIPLLELENKQLKEKEKKKSTLSLDPAQQMGRLWGGGVCTPWGRCPDSWELLVSPKTGAAPFYQCHCSLERKSQSNPCFGNAWLGDVLWGSQLFFQPERLILMLFFLPLPPVYSFGRGLPEGQLSGWRSHSCPLTEGVEGAES